MAGREAGSGEPGSTEAPGARTPPSSKPTGQSGPPAHPRRAGGLVGLLRGLLGGFLQRLRGWGHGLLSYGPIVPGERLLLVKRLRAGAAYGAGFKVVLTARKGWDRAFREPLPAVLGYLRPFKVTLGFMVCGAGANAVLFYLQLRYHQTDLSVLPPEGIWQRTLRILFGARPPAKRASPPGAPPLRAPAAAAGPAALRPEVPPAGAAGAAAAATPAASPAAGSVLAGSPASSFVDVNSSPPRLPAPGQEGAWSDVPLGGTHTHTASSTPEDWTEVGQSGGASPHPGGSPTAAAAARGQQEGEGQWAEAAAQQAGTGPPRISFEHVEGSQAQQ